MTTETAIQFPEVVLGGPKTPRDRTTKDQGEDPRGVISSRPQNRIIRSIAEISNFPMQDLFLCKKLLRGL
ncbi:hypothetical protein PFLUV_G00085090 [Perca fluviatilis]|uniref:Uncharacterized protein n=1 Tax=Perca fluviatilis TaxID=8168 RepID=A0A6A5EF31_PERFL|nr:hypothetical protein PFLUV_G00085090 [Perca fluviatilis]